MDRHPYAVEIEACGVLAVVRVADASALMHACRALVSGGITGIEITMSVPKPYATLRELTDEFGDDIQLGIGSVVDEATAQRAIGAGAKYVVSPIFSHEVVRTARAAGVVSVAGALTPTEAYNATAAGADIVKIFPADQMGMGYFKSVMAPMPNLRLMPTGGVTIDNAGDWIRAGAVAVGVGSALLDTTLIRAGAWDELARNAARLKQGVLEARREKEEQA